MKSFVRWMAPSLALLLLLVLAVAASAETQVPDNLPPIAENLDLTTYRSVSVGGVLSAVDPEGDTVSFEITTPPGKGDVTLEEDGHFVYTPRDGRRGKDYFGYRATDSAGNASQEATVVIRITRQRSRVTYSDMEGQAGAYAAIVLSEKGLFTGEQLAGQYLFRPDVEVTRAEFLAMCMKLAGQTLPEGVLTTGFSDDDAIGAWARPYVSTALRTGLIDGYPSDTGTAAFDAARPITFSEAAVILDRALDLTDTRSVWNRRDEALPVWAQQSVSDLDACDMIPYGVDSASQVLERGQAAEMLLKAMAVLSDR